MSSVQVLLLSHTSYVALGELFNLLWPLFSHLSNGNNNGTSFMELLLRGLNQIAFVILAQGLQTASNQ